MYRLFLTIITSLAFISLKAQDSTHCYIFIAEECPISIYMIQPLKKAIEAHGETVQFHAVFPKKNSTKKTAQQFLNDYELSNIHILLDNQQELSKKMGATITPEAIITDKSGTLLYRGRISDAYSAPGRMKHGPRNNDLLDILTTMQNGENIGDDWAPAIGCYITFHK